MSVKNYSKNVPCIPIALKNDVTLYLLDDDKNIVFSLENKFISRDFENIKKNYYNKTKQENYIKTTSYIHNCKPKEVEFFDLTKKPEVFLAPEVIITDNILDKYNLADINLNIFEKTKLFNYYITSFNLELYKKIIDKDKKRLAIILYLNYYDGDLFFMKDLSSKLSIEKQKSNFNENEYITKYYKDNEQKIEDSIIVLTDFKNVFDIIVPKKEEPEKEEPKKEEPKKEEPKKDPLEKIGGIGGLLGIIFGCIAVICFFIWFKYFRKSSNNKIAPAT